MDYSGVISQCPVCNCERLAPPVVSKPAAVQISGANCEVVTCGAHCIETAKNNCPHCDCDPACREPSCHVTCDPDDSGKVTWCPRCECQVHCETTTCDAHCIEVLRNGCPRCDCDPACTNYPLCATTCNVDASGKHSWCPRCECSGAVCDDLPCGFHCVESDIAGCPNCDCDPSCTQPICPPSCDSDESGSLSYCPRCECTETCEHVDCGGHCRSNPGPNGCLSCVCKSSCNVPECESGCTLDYSGKKSSCPICACDGNDAETHETLDTHNHDTHKDDHTCPDLKCGGFCREISGPVCPACLCDPVCPMTSCAPACKIDYSGDTTVCPRCECDKSLTQVAPVSSSPCYPVHCGGHCKATIGNDGCPICSCDSSLCAPATCPSHCRTDYSGFHSTCPCCVCDDEHSPGGFHLCCPSWTRKCV